MHNQNYKALDIFKSSEFTQSYRNQSWKLNGVKWNVKTKSFKQYLLDESAVTVIGDSNRNYKGQIRYQWKKFVGI